MSLESEFQALTAVMIEVRDLLKQASGVLPAAAPARAPKAPKAAKEKAPSAPEAPPIPAFVSPTSVSVATVAPEQEWTYETVQMYASEISNKLGNDSGKLVQLLADFGVSRLSALPKAAYPDFVKGMENLLVVTG